MSLQQSQLVKTDTWYIQHYPRKIGTNIYIFVIFIQKARGWLLISIDKGSGEGGKTGKEEETSNK